jgi:uncharacterized protein YecT (DUF1311 family)
MIEIKDILLILLGALLSALSWVARRYITGSHKDERAARLDKALDVAEKLKRTGMSVDQAQSLADRLVGENSTLSTETIQKITFLEQDGGEESRFTLLDTTAAMGAQLDARLAVLDAEIAELFLKLEILVGDQEHFEALKEAHEAWTKYRMAEGSAAAIEMMGGTGATVNSLATEIMITESRIEALKQTVEDYKQRYG